MKKLLLLTALLAVGLMLPAFAQAQTRTVTGRVVDENNAPLTGVAVQMKGNSSVGVSTDAQGRYLISLPPRARALTFTFVGKETKEVILREGVNSYNVTLASRDIEAQTVTVQAGIMTRESATFSGAFTQVSQAQLKEAGTYNVVSALSLLDPEFSMVRDDDMGSDPNTLPTIEIGGKTALRSLTDGAENDPNLPLFVVDGFESTYQYVYDLDVNRVASITILKDAGSTAIYGAKGANGVVVVELVKPKVGELRVSYSLNGTVSYADLSSYNLMNSREKLDFEVKSGFYNVSVPYDHPKNETNYHNIKTLVESGVDTYWLKYPLRTAVGHQHHLEVSGGDGSLLYQATVGYGSNPGVMKDVTHDVINGGTFLQYRKGELNISNKMNFSSTISKNGAWGSFSDWSRAAPYYTPYDEFGNANTKSNLNPYSSFESDATQVKMGTSGYFFANPMYNALLETERVSKNINFTNQTKAIYTHKETGLRLEGAINFSRGSGVTEDFVDPYHTKFRNAGDPSKEGTFSFSENDTWKFGGNFSASYARAIKEAHYFNFLVRTSADQSNVRSYADYVEGLPKGAKPNPSQGTHPEDSKPSYGTGVSRNVTFMGTMNYNYKQRYIFDATFNYDGTTSFGKNNPFTNNWSIGAAWNIHREPFAENWTWTTNMKLRGSTGTSANLNTAGLSSSIYNIGLGSDYFGQVWYLSQLANLDLQWAKTRQDRIGLELNFLDNRLMTKVEVFRKVTDPMVLSFQQAPSTGVTAYDINLGSLTVESWNVNATYHIMRRPEDRMLFSVRATAAQQRQTYGGFGNAFERLNVENMSEDNAIERRLIRYRDGADADAVWAVRSLGIDPATGQEVFLTKDGKPTFKFNSADEVELGTSRATLYGSIGLTFNYKHFRSSMNFQYSFGALRFNTALYSKVENISRSNLLQNQDKRALYNRWSYAGQIAEFKGISLTKTTPISSRFLQKEKYLDATSIQLGWDFYESRFLEMTGLKSLIFNVSTNDIFRLSDVRRERGIDSPFARVIRFSLSTNF